MKKLLAIIALSTLVLASCQSEKKLADKIAGTWSGNPERLFHNSVGEATLTETYTFQNNDANGHGGDVTIRAMVSLAKIMPSVPGDSIQPITLTGSGEATISATWEADDDDEIDIYVNIADINVNIDPEGLKVTTNVNDMSAYSDKPNLQELTPVQIAWFQQELNQALVNYYKPKMELDDIEFAHNDTYLTCKLNHKKLTLARDL